MEPNISDVLKDPIQEFVETLDEREKMIRELYSKTNGNLVAMATQLGITKAQTSQLVKVVYFKALQFARERQQQ